jgi:uncharacterized protein (TIGR03083 family)
MQPAYYLTALRRYGKRMAAAAEDALDQTVPSCPGWTVADLICHLGKVHAIWRQIATGVIPGPEAYAEPKRPADSELVDWFRAGVDETAAILTALDPATPAWSWAPQKNVASFSGAWHRRRRCTAGTFSPPSARTSRSNVDLLWTGSTNF